MSQDAILIKRIFRSTWKRTESQASRRAFRIKAPTAIINAPIGHTINATVAAHIGWNIPSNIMFIMTFHVMAVKGLAPKIHISRFNESST